MTPTPRVALAAALVLGLVGCSSGSKSPTAPNRPAGTPVDLLDNPIFNDEKSNGTLAGVSSLGGATFQLDPVAGTGEVLPLRGATATDDSYLLSLQNFFSSSDIRITSIESTTNELVIGYSISHPFPAPANLSAPPNGATNRADLGITGRAVFLADVPSATGNTFFTNVVANTALFGNMDGYIQPAGTIPQSSGLTATAFPFKLIVDEAAGTAGSRKGISNAGSPHGNYRPTDGWQGSNMGTTNDQWTGFDYLHQGQTSLNTFTLKKSGLTSGFSFDVVILAKYTDPRGGSSASEKRGNRLPAAGGDITRFVYRLPYAALDVAKSTYRGETGGLTPNVPLSSTNVRFTVRDWDTRSAVTASTDLSLDNDVDTVEVGGAGAPTITVDIPGVSTSLVTATLTDDDSVIGGDVAAESGESNDPLYYVASVLNTAGTGGQSAGTMTGLARITDISDAADRSAYEFVLDPDLNLITNPADKLKLEIYQAFEVGLGGVANDPPLATIDLLGGPNPLVASAGNVVFQLQSEIDTESDTVFYDIDTAYSGSFVPDATGVDPANPPTTLFTGTAPVNSGASNLAVEARVRYYDTAHTLTPIEVILPYEIAPAGSNLPPTATIVLQGGANPTIPSGGSLQFNLTAENDPDADAVQYEIDYNYSGVFAADVPAFDPPGVPPLTLNTSPAQTNPGPGPSARTARVRYFDPLRAATPIVVDLPYSIADPSCSLATQQYLFTAGAEGWQQGPVFDLPNDDDLGWGNFAQDACVDPEAETAAGGLLSGGYLSVAYDPGSCSFEYDYGGDADFNMVSPPLVVPALCGANQVGVTFDLLMYGRPTASLQVYTSTNEGCSWVPQGSPVIGTGASQVLGNTSVIFTGVNAGQEVYVRLQYRDTDTNSISDSTTGYVGAWIDNVRVTATSGGSWTAGTTFTPPTYFGDAFESGNTWVPFGLPQTDGALIGGAGATCGFPGPWGGWNVCTIFDVGTATGSAMVAGGDNGSCIDFREDMAHSSDFNTVSPLFSTAGATASSIIRLDEIIGCFQVPWTTNVYMAVNPAPGDLPAWGAPVVTFNHAALENLDTTRLSVPVPAPFRGVANVRIRVQVTTAVASPVPDICSSSTGYTLTDTEVGFDNIFVQEPRCP